MERRVRGKIGLGEKRVGCVKFGNLLDSFVEMSGTMMLNRRELWLIGRNWRPQMSMEP